MLILGTLLLTIINGQTCSAPGDSCVERTFIALKPDAIQRGLVGDIINRFERKGFHLLGLKFVQPSRQLVEKHYEEHLGRPFYEGLVNYMTSGPVLASVWEGKNIISSSRSLLGATDPSKAAPGTIRGDLATQVGRNLVHASDSPANAEREIGLWFQPEEVQSWSRALKKWINEEN
ncbi:Oidioi.mRNA.OKI2018_I69.chr1.g1575.t1.cds [Oikopleura dioica]|uniref:Nucleoside diphosphate kinase n=1 Tax=Oikopleura dioica TaxID=34765 RepID=A0ABN7SSK5_OIKDI|nr:Oidioi.mRNA.OKI2018_I69.chr1.g1575.t1.cds [Oikopleura dioica]